MVYLIFFGRIEVKMGKKFYLKDTKLTRKIKRIMKKKGTSKLMFWNTGKTILTKPES